MELLTSVPTNSSVARLRAIQARVATAVAAFRPLARVMQVRYQLR
jgi:hypothetical protein